MRNRSFCIVQMIAHFLANMEQIAEQEENGLHFSGTRLLYCSILPDGTRAVNDKRERVELSSKVSKSPS